MNQGKILANDSVENLKDIFNVHLYDFILKGKHQLAELKTKFDVTEVEPENGSTRLRVSLKDSDSFYSLVNQLQKEDMKLEKVQNLDANMEEIFMNVINNKGARR